MPSQNHVLRRRCSVGRLSQILFVAVVATAIGIGYWARNLTVTAITEGGGVVQNIGKTVQVVSATDGTVVPHEIADGMIVTQDQVLFRIETVTEVAVAQKAPPVPKLLRTAAARLRAEVDGAERIAFPKDIDGSAEAGGQRALFLERRSKLNRAVQALRDTVRQARLEIEEHRATAVRTARARDLAQKELDLLKPLVDRGISPKLEILRVQQKVQDLEAQREQALLALPRLEASIRDGERSIESTGTDFRREAKRLLLQNQREIATAKRTTISKKRDVSTTVIRAPIAGKIRHVLVGKRGAKVEDGKILALIDPPRKEIFVNASVPAASRIGARIGQDATVTFNVMFSFVSIQAKVFAVDTADSSSSRQIRIRIDAGTPGFDDLANYEGDVRVTVLAEQPILTYLLDRISFASGGNIWERLTGH